MTTQSTNPKVPKLLDFVLSFLVVLLFILSKIGDGVIFLVKQPVVIIIKITRFLRKTLIQSPKLFPKLPTINLRLSFRKLTLILKTPFVFFRRVLQKIGGITLKLNPKKIFIKKVKPATNLPKQIAVPPKTKIRKKKSRFSFYSFILGILLTIVFVFVPYNLYTFLKSLPNPKLLTENHSPVTTKIYDRNGNLLYEIFTDQNRTPIKLSNVPQQLIDATIAIEDKEFYYHPGFSTKGITRAINSIVFQKNLQGGSTITQQLIKSALLTNERTVQRKIKEILLAFWAERLYSKDQILEMYLNQVPYGGTAWGIEAASETYFGKNVSELTLAEAALLAGLPNAPTLYSPFGAHPELSLIRRNQVLDEMAASGKITREEANTAKEEEPHFAPQITNIKAPHFVMYVREILEQKYGIRQIEQGGLRVTTSLDLTIQDKAQEIVSQEVENLKALSVGNGAALVTNPKTGEILAMVGSKNYFDLAASGNVNITTSLQQPGSSIKVVNYAAALENGFTAASIIDDSPVSYPLPNQLPYQPVNYDGKFHGKVTLRKALGNSYNIPAVKVLSKIGVDKMIEYGKNMGIESWTDPNRFGLSLTLGGGEVTMLDMARVYNTLSAQGKNNPLTPVLKVENYEGQILEDNTEKVKGKQVLKPETAFILSDILSDNQARTDAFGPSSKLVIPGKTVAVKTGTSNDKRDNWAIGYTPSYTVTVWVGNNDNSPMNPVLTSGITGATPIWNGIMTFLLQNKNDEPFSQPTNITTLPCYGRIEYFVSGTQPAGGCPTIIPNTPTPTP